MPHEHSPGSLNSSEISPANLPELVPGSELVDRDFLTPLERLESARPDFEELVTKLAPDIRVRRWDALLGDDVSGRVTALLLHGVMARWYREQGYSAPQTFFLALGRSRWDEGEQENALFAYLSEAKKPHRVLFITDNVGTGTTVSQMQELLDTFGVANDVASAQAETGLLHNVSLSHLERQPDARFYGVDSRPRNSDTQQLHASSFTRPRWRSAIGVESYGNPTTEALRSHALRKTHGGELKSDTNLPVNADVTELRYAIDYMAEELYNKFILA